MSCHREILNINWTALRCLEKCLISRQIEQVAKPVAAPVVGAAFGAWNEMQAKFLADKTISILAADAGLQHIKHSLAELLVK